MATTVAFKTFDLAPNPAELNTFQRLPEDERMKLIIRVLCGLVAMEDRPEQLRGRASGRGLQCVSPLSPSGEASLDESLPADDSIPAEVPTPESLRPDLGVTRTRRFRLPFLGLEAGGEKKWATMSGGAR